MQLILASITTHCFFRVLRSRIEGDRLVEASVHVEHVDVQKSSEGNLGRRRQRAVPQFCLPVVLGRLPLVPDLHKGEAGKDGKGNNLDLKFSREGYTKAFEKKYKVDYYIHTWSIDIEKEINHAFKPIKMNW